MYQDSDIVTFISKYSYLKVELSLPKKSRFYFLQWKPLKNDEKSFLFHLKRFLCFYDLLISI